MSYIGTTEIGKMFLGDVEIDKAYLGDELVFSSASEPTPVSPVFYDYLYFDGTAYIDTDIIPDSLASYVVPLGSETLKATQRIFMVEAGSSYNIGVILVSSTTSTYRYFSAYYGATSSVSSNRRLAFSYSTFNFFLTPKRLGWGDVSYTFTKGSNTPTGGLVLGYNWGHSGQPYTGRMGIFRIYGSDAQNVSDFSAFNNYTPLVTLRPCTNNGVAGMWYVEGNKFYGNSASSGVLTASNS